MVDVGAVEKARAVLAADLPRVEAVLDEPSSDPELVSAARAHLAGEASPVGAAVVAVLLGSEAWAADAMVVRHGLPLAARAVVEMPGVEVHRTLWSSCLRRVPEPGEVGLRTARRLRALLAEASDAEHEDAVEAVGSQRTGLGAMVLASYLFPTRRDWVDEALGEVERTEVPERVRASAVLAYSVGTVAQVDRVLRRYPRHGRDGLFTVVDGVGPDAVPALAVLLDTGRESDGDVRDVVLEAMAAFPTPATFDALLARLEVRRVLPTVVDLARRDPVTALHRFAAAEDPVAGRLLERHLTSNPELAERDDLPDAVRESVEQTRAALDVAPPGALPAVLVDPPWVAEVVPAEPLVVKGLRAVDRPAVEWEPGERERYEGGLGGHAESVDWAPTIEEYLAGGLHGVRQVALFAHGPVDVLRPLVAEWDVGAISVGADDGKRLLARFGVDAIPNALAIATLSREGKGDLVAPVVSLKAARLVAKWLVKLKSAQEFAPTWLRRHAGPAARLLVPDAVGKPGGARQAAEAALRVIPEEAVAAAREYGPEAEKAVEAVLADVPPVVAPGFGDWLDPVVLPPVRLCGTRQALPADAVRNLLVLLALSTPDVEHAGVEAVREACDAASLARFSWELFELWRKNGMPAEEGWVLPSLGLLGDDGTARALEPFIRVWPGESQHARAVVGLDVLAAIGTDTALGVLNRIAQRVAFGGIRYRAREKVEEVAAGMGLTADELGDRLVPDLGLDDAAATTVDYGPRRFTIGFDEQLRPFVLDGAGTRLKALPKPGAQDDGELAVAEHKRFGQLKEDVRAVAADQVVRLERSMVLERRWPAAAFRALLVAHPLLRHLVRRLVWVTGAGRSFRVAEDGTFADVRDDTFPLPEDAVVGVAHSVHLGEDVAPWAEVFADYGILQPFRQLGRPVHRFTEAELSSGVLDGYRGVRVDAGRLLGLTKGEWERGTPMDAGIENGITRSLPGGGSIAITLDPGLVVGMPHESGPQHLREVGLVGAGRTFAELSPVTASELLAELATLVD
ncbi:uncharacterized protein DUF4132 [Umezawaea tangerina]|uniref:Uncharacterized protein DUF4132 n=1 Tax=Umezawaea tangerina TaxID=84725 RepID=A0A2T0T714_9PSEU|nr:uncharacterized protein DUF4132 [Umezawaea tangerina]